MIIGFARRGGDGDDGTSAIDYLAAGAVNYVTGERSSKGTHRSHPPEILRGDPELTAAIIRSVPFRHKYSSAIVSFDPKDPATPEVQEKIMDEFERHAFAGLKRGVDYDILWVRHRQAHTHLHLITPRLHLRGRSLNIAPPGSRRFYDLLRTKLNLQFGMADPTDPARAQAVRLPKHIARLRAAKTRDNRECEPDIREVVASHVLAKVRDGSILDRAGVVETLREAGLTIRREGRNFITVIHPETGRPTRLRGKLFEHPTDFQALVNTPIVPRPAHDASSLKEVSAELERLRARREEYNRQRYPRECAYGIDRSPINPDQALRLDRNTEAHDRPRETSDWDYPGIGDTGPAERCRSRWAYGRIGRAIGGLNNACERLGRSVEQANSWQRERQADEEVIAKYGISPRSAGRGRELGMDMEKEVELA